MRKKLSLLALASIMILGVAASCERPDPGCVGDDCPCEGDNCTPPPDLCEDGGDDCGGVPFAEPTRTITESKLVTYDGPKNMTSSSLATVTVSSRPIFLYETRVNLRRQFTYNYPTTYVPVGSFDFEGKVPVEVTINSETSLTDVVVTPRAYGIVPTVTGNKISFEIDQPCTYTIEYNNQSDDVIHLFANPLETEAERIDPNNVPADVLYIGPGAYESGAIPIDSNKTVYLAGGAFVYGQVRAELMENMTIRGRGIFSGEIFERRNEAQYVLPIEMKSSKNILIDGIGILDPAGWAITIYDCEDVTIKNVKIITARANGDGISIQGSKNVTTTDSFVRTWDDSLVVKCNDGLNTENIRFENIVVWTDLAQSMEVGYETNGQYLRNVTFRGITVLHNFHKPAMSIHVCEDANVSNVKFIDITVEDGMMLGDNSTPNDNDNFFIDLDIRFSPVWSDPSLGGALGSISNVLFSNVKVLKIHPAIVTRVMGDVKNGVNGVTFRNIDYAGTAVDSEDDLKLVKNSYVSNLSFPGTDLSQTPGAMLRRFWNLALTSSAVAASTVASPAQTALLVPSFARFAGALPFVGPALNVTMTDAKAWHGNGDVISSVPTYDTQFVAPGSSANNFTDGIASTSYVSPSWKNTDKEFVALEIDFDKAYNFGLLRIYGDTSNTYSYKLDVEIRAKKTATANFTKVTSRTNEGTYPLTPASGNYFDIQIDPLEYFALQIRIYRLNGVHSIPNVSLSGIDFFNPSKSFQKPVVDASEYEDIYDVGYITDGNDKTYYESNKAAGLPAFFVIDLLRIEEVSVIVFHLPPLLTWNTRTQEIEVFGSASESAYSTSNPPSFTSIVAKTAYTFDPIQGNLVTMTLSPTANVRYLKFVIYSNSNAAGYGAQVSEVKVF